MLSYILGIKHLDAILSKQPGEHTLPFYLLAAEAAVIYFLHATAGTAWLQNCQIHLFFQSSCQCCLRSLAKSTLMPSLFVTMPSTISAGKRGVESPPNCSGQTPITSCPSIKSNTLWFKLLPPLYLQFLPNKQALTRIFKETFLRYCKNKLLTYRMLTAYFIFILPCLFLQELPAACHQCCGILKPPIPIRIRGFFVKPEIIYATFGGAFT